MYKIYKITSDAVVDFAAQELKKYLRMMMPRCGEVSVEYLPDAKDGFRLGLMQDFLWIFLRQRIRNWTILSTLTRIIRAVSLPVTIPAVCCWRCISI